MQLTTAILMLGAGLASAHYTFPALILDGKTTKDWEYVKRSSWPELRAPIVDVTSEKLLCYRDPNGPAASTATVKVGEKIGFRIDPYIFHPGPFLFYMAKVPEGKTAAEFNGEGAVWFKIFEDNPALTSNGLFWQEGQKEVYVTLPICIPDGEYLLRVEHIALQAAAVTGGAQFYNTCAQLNVTGARWDAKPGKPLVAFPGAYNETDPGIKIGIYWPDTISYTNPGPPVYNCFL
ncbi:hypothetical protein TWF730_007661 [Orbilia blumenaviensis]|uniref:lytic cellulose monooxygenase (C4-dehydrogenating) n=1 Tax=Orbilia blumenaviensis TaxID=1796055 RepID=A0AAV9VEX9_9PEZI